MGIKDFYGKLFLREGDLMPQEINDFSIKRYEFGFKHFEALQNFGLLFDDMVKAKKVSDTIRSLIQDIKNGSTAFESDIAEAKHRPRIYISGPISGHDIEERRKVFNEVEAKLRRKGFDTINPTRNGLPAEATTHEHMRRDIELLMKCNCIYMMKHWSHSAGCMTEFHVARAIGLPVAFEESNQEIKFE